MSTMESEAGTSRSPDEKKTIVIAHIGENVYFLDKHNPQIKFKTEAKVQDVKITLMSEKIERRRSCSVADWSDLYKRTKVVQLLGQTINYYGLDTTDGLYLYPEEALYLLKKNKLVLYRHGQQLTLDFATTMYLNRTDIDIHKFSIYYMFKERGYCVYREVDYRLQKKFPNIPLPILPTIGSDAFPIVPLPEGAFGPGHARMQHFLGYNVPPTSSAFFHLGRDPDFYILPPLFKHEVILYFKLYFLPIGDEQFINSEMRFYEDEIFICYNETAYRFFGAHYAGHGSFNCD